MPIESPSAPGTTDELVQGEKMIVSAHTGGVLLPDSYINKRQHMKALREDVDELRGHHRWSFTRLSDGVYAIQHVVSGRYVEPLRKSEDSAVYENVRYRGPILLETGPIAEARNAWEIRRRGDYFQIGLRGTRYVIGLTHPDHADSWVTLLDPWWSTDRLWLIHDATG